MTDCHLGGMTEINPHPPFQDVVDLFDFRAAEGLPLPEGWPKVRAEARQLSFRGIMERLYGTDQQKVYWLAELPERIIQTFVEASLPEPPQARFTNYVTSREIHYAIASYFGFTFDVDEQDLPLGAIATGTTVILELHEENHSKHVKLGYYYPGQHATQERAYTSKLKWVTMPNCPGVLCPFVKFMEIFVERERAAGGTYESLCASVPSADVAINLSILEAQSWLLLGAVVLFAGLTVAVAVRCRSTAPADYLPIAGGE